MPYEQNMENLIADLLTPPQLFDSDTVVFMVYKQGFMGCGIHGLDTTLSGAIELAQFAADNDRDVYHSYDIYPIPLNRPPAFPNINQIYQSGWMNQEPLFSTRKKNYNEPRKFLSTVTEHDTIFYVIYYHQKNGYSGIWAVSKSLERAASILKKAQASDNDTLTISNIYRIPLGKPPSPGSNYKDDRGWMNLSPVDISHLGLASNPDTLV